MTVIDTSTEITVGNITVNESNNTVVLDVVRSGYLQHETSLSYNTENGSGINSTSAMAGLDYDANIGDLLFAVGETVKTIEIVLTDDGLLEGEERFTLQLSNLINATTESDSVEITLTDDDVAEFNEETFSPSVNEDEVLTGTVETTNLADGVSASYSMVTQAQNGIVTINADGSYEYTPTGNYNGNDSFQVLALISRDGNTVTENLLTLNITVDPINDAPTFALGEIAVETKANTEIAGSVTATDADIEDLSYSLETEATHGNVQVNNDGDYIYTPDVDYFGTDNFSLQVIDAAGDKDIVDIIVTVIDTSTEVIINNVVVNESDNSVTLDFVRSGYLLHETSFKYTTQGLSATTGVDYIGTGGDLLFETGETTKSIVITLLEDDLVEGTENFNFLISDRLMLWQNPTV